MVFFYIHCINIYVEFNRKERKPLEQALEQGD
jgi:hypothetical protein